MVDQGDPPKGSATEPIGFVCHGSADDPQARCISVHAHVIPDDTSAKAQACLVASEGAKYQSDYRRHKSEATRSSLLVTHQSAHQLVQWIKVLASHLECGNPPCNLQGTLMSLPVMVDVVGGAILLHVWGATEQECWEWLDVRMEAFADLDPRLQY